MNRIAIVSCLLAAPFLAHAQTTPVSCTAATLNGTYALVYTGRDILPSVALTKEIMSVGTITFDGVSAVTASVTTDTNQAAGGTQTLSGTYTLPSNCVGTVNITTGDTASFTVIPYNKGAYFTLTGQDGTYQFTGSGNPQPGSCLLSTLSGNYVFNGNGFALSAGAVTGVNFISGILQFDGAGSVAGNWSIATNGTAAPDTVSGHYTFASSGCTGSATLTDPGGTAFTVNFVMTSTNMANMSGIVATSTEAFSMTAHSTFTNPGLSVANAAGVSTGTPPGSLFSI